SNIALTSASSRVPGVPGAGPGDSPAGAWADSDGVAADEEASSGPANADCSLGFMPRRDYCSCARKPTTCWNFFGGRFLNDGLGGVGLRCVEAIAAAGSRDPTCVRLGPGPSLPFEPITWQARQPDWPTTSSPARNTRAWLADRLDG